MLSTINVETRAGSQDGWLLLLALAGLSCFICLYFLEVFWWPPDDGAYAYVAERINSGAVLHRDIQDVHMGYINVMNAALLRWFGDDFTSLRLPLVLTTMLQAVLVGRMLLDKGPVVATAGAMAMASLTLVQFVNPSANWYALFLAVILIAFLQLTTRDCPGRLFVAGFILANLFLFRQLSGVIAAIACVSYLFHEAESDKPSQLAPGDKWFPFALLVLMLAGLCTYLALKVNTSGIMLFGVFPVLVLIYQIQRLALPNGEAVPMVLKLGTGFVAGMLPMVVYHLANHTLPEWLNDTVIVATGMTDLEFFRQASFSDYLMETFLGLNVANPVSLINGVFWLVLILVPAVYGMLLVARLRNDRRVFEPLAYIPVFYMLVSVHYEITIYLFYSVALVLVALLSLTAERHRYRFPVSAGVLILCLVGLVFHAGQPLARGVHGAMQGDTSVVTEACGLPHCSVRADALSIRERKHLVSLIIDNVADDESILVLPFNPELYYLSRRYPPVSFYNAAFAVRDRSEVARTLEQVQQGNVKVLIVNRRDKYFTAPVSRLAAALTGAGYVAAGSIGEFEVYLRKDTT